MQNKFENQLREYPGAWGQFHREGGHGPGHVWYDLFADKVMDVITV